MIEIDNTLISEEILENDFVCNLDACKGACCVEGDAGAPVEDDEVEILERIYHKVAPYLSEQGRKAIEAQGTAVRGSDGEWETPLINGGECAYVVRDEKGIVLCGIEQAYREGKIDWKKPISCHLYPIRLKSYPSFIGIGIGNGKRNPFAVIDIKLDNNELPRLSLAGNFRRSNA